MLNVWYQTVQTVCSDEVSPGGLSSTKSRLKQSEVHVFENRVQSFPSGQFSDGDAPFDPQRVDVAERSQSVVEVKQLLSVHKHTKPTLFTVNLNLRGEKRHVWMFGQLNLTFVK